MEHNFFTFQDKGETALVCGNCGAKDDTDPTGCPGIIPVTLVDPERGDSIAIAHMSAAIVKSYTASGRIFKHEDPGAEAAEEDWSAALDALDALRQKVQPRVLVAILGLEGVRRA